TKLLAQLIVIVVVEVGDAGVQANDGLDGLKLVLARNFFVVDEGALQLGLLAHIVGRVVDPTSAGLFLLCGRLSRWRTNASKLARSSGDESSNARKRAR